VSSLPRRLLRLEGLAVLAGAVALYFHLGYGLNYPTGFKDTHLQRV
jgi:hypothetical protein